VAHYRRDAPNRCRNGVSSLATRCPIAADQICQYRVFCSRFKADLVDRDRGMTGPQVDDQRVLAASAADVHLMGKRLNVGPRHQDPRWPVVGFVNLEKRSQPGLRDGKGERRPQNPSTKSVGPPHRRAVLGRDGVHATVRIATWRSTPRRPEWLKVPRSRSETTTG